MNTILFIAGGIWQKPFVQYLKDKGHHISIVNPVITETTKLADYHIQCDINNINEIKKHKSKLNPIFVVSDQSDISTAIVARLNDDWNLPGNKPEVIHKLTNKLAIYEFGLLINVPVPHTEVVESLLHVKNFGKTQGYPIIIKPVDSTMSRGFRKLNSELDATQESLTESIKFSKIGQVIVQKFISGDMVTLDGVCSGGKHKTLATSRKREYFKAGIVSEIRYPADYPEEFIERLININDKYVEMSGMEFGLTHSEYLVNNDYFCLLEIGARGGGAGIANKIVPWVSGINNYEIFYKSLMGEIIDVKILNPLKKSALLKYYLKEEVNKEQADKIKKIPGVSVFCHNFLETQFKPDNNDCRYSMAIYIADNSKEIKNIEISVNKIINPNP